MRWPCVMKYDVLEIKKCFVCVLFAGHPLSDCYKLDVDAASPIEGRDVDGVVIGASY